MNSIIGIIKSLGNSELLVLIIIVLIVIIILLGAIIVAILKRVSKSVVENFNKVISTRATEIAVVKTSLEALTTEIEDMKQKIDKNNETTTLLAYHQCMNEAMNWKSKGEISVGAKMHFDKVWNAYITLGDGHGDDPKRIIDKLPIVN